LSYGSDLTEVVIGLAIEVHRALGPGLLEQAYEQCLALALTDAGIDFVRQSPIDVTVRTAKLVGAYRVDLLVENQLVVEVKAIERLLPIHEAQLLTYLKLGNFRTGLLFNFNVTLLKLGMRRLVN
jgi:GxxExxY protein